MRSACEICSVPVKIRSNMSVYHHFRHALTRPASLIIRRCSMASNNGTSTLPFMMRLFLMVIIPDSMLFPSFFLHRRHQKPNWASRHGWHKPARQAQLCEPRNCWRTHSGLPRFWQWWLGLCHSPSWSWWHLLCWLWSAGAEHCRRQH